MPVFRNIAIAIFFVSVISTSTFAAGQCSAKSGSERTVPRHAPLKLEMLLIAFSNAGMMRDCHTE